jgi:hypothetical protein
MDMITQRRVLRQEATQQAHEEVKLLVQGNKDIHHLVEEHHALIARILHAESIICLHEQDPIPA